jgi:protein-tyrosine phosphatase
MTSCIAPKCDFDAVPGTTFCARHLLAPAGKRGGWLSAHKRAQRRGHGVALDASAISRRLWVGSVPPFDRELPDFQMLVLCAYEHQPKPADIAFQGSVVRCPILDDTPTPWEKQRVLDAARQVATALSAKQTVLVTCHAGRNRSALVAGLSLCMVTRASGAQIVEVLRSRRPNALTNPHFVGLLERVPKRR